MTSQITELFYSTLNESFDTAITAVEEVHTARSAVPLSRDVEEDYSTGPQSYVGQRLDDARNEINKWRGKGLPIPSLTTVSGLLDAGLNDGAIDDRKMLLETGLSTMSSLPKGAVADLLNQKVVTLLYRDLPHPPASYIGDTYAWRQPDGSHNNPAQPDLGKAGTPYARSVQGVTAMPMCELPDPGLVFDSLLKRERFVPHPAGLSAMMFGFATLVIHTCFRTNLKDWTINDTSSYVDLSPLYGNSKEDQDRLRRKDGTGMMWNDVFAEDRLLFLPPITSTLLVLFCRNHNHIATKLLELNERGTWTVPGGLASSAGFEKQDDEIFNIARLINSAHFAGIVFSDYLAAILGLSKDANPWSMDPFSVIRNSDHTLVERGQGNANSVEFNLLYRWHATTSEPDEQWVDDIMKSVFGKPAEEVTVEDFQNLHKGGAGDLKKTLKKAMGGKATGDAPKDATEAANASSSNNATANSADDGSSPKTKDPRSWTFAGLQRGPDGKFKDAELARICQDATSHPAGAFKARGTPEVMRVVEIMTMKMARRWGVCTLNEFRKSLGLRTYTSFEEWNPNPDIWQPAQALYESIDRLELYPGLQAEEAKPPGPGAGLCPGYTISRAILADAVALTRGDRFYTHDFTPAIYTAWGYKDCQSNPSNPGAGSVLGPLLLRTLPRNYTENSVYTWFSMMTPDAMRDNLIRLGKEKRYTFYRPIATMEARPIENAAEVLEIVGRGSKGYKSAYSTKAKEIIEGGGYLSLLDDTRCDSHRRAIQQAIFHNIERTTHIARNIESKARSLIYQKSFSLVGHKTKCVDIVKDVLTLAPIHWIADAIGLPLKTHDHTFGTIFEQQADQMFKDIYAHIFHEVDPACAVNLRDACKKHVKFLRRYLEPQVHSSTGLLPIPTIHNIKDAIVNYWVDRRAENDRFYDSMTSNGFSKQDVMNDVLALAILATVELSHIFVNVVNFYLEEDNSVIREKLCAAATGDSPDGLMEIEEFVREAIRRDPAVVGVLRETSSSIILHQEDSNISSSDRVFLSLKKAMLDKAGIKPTNVDMKRPRDQRLLMGDGTAKLLGEEFIVDTTAHILRAVFSLKNVRRAPGPSGTLRRYEQMCHGTPQYYYIDQKQNITLWPTSMLIEFDLV